MALVKGALNLDRFIYLPVTRSLVLLHYNKIRLFEPDTVANAIRRRNNGLSGWNQAAASPSSLLTAETTA